MPMPQSFWWMRRSLKQLKERLGRVFPDIERKMAD